MRLEIPPDSRGLVPAISSRTGAATDGPDETDER
jgi:hypothetical protein